MLRRNLPPSRKTVIKRILMQRRMRESPRHRRVREAARAELLARSNEQCEIGLTGCYGRGTEISHRLGGKMGGRHRDGLAESYRLANVLWACRGCHRWCHAHPGEAQRMGLMLREGEDPQEVALMLQGRLVRIFDDGCWEWVQTG